jgi:hypothetical protein
MQLKTEVLFSCVSKGKKPKGKFSTVTRAESAERMALSLSFMLSDDVLQLDAMFSASVPDRRRKFMLPRFGLLRKRCS